MHQQPSLLFFLRFWGPLILSTPFHLPQSPKPSLQPLPYPPSRRITPPHIPLKLRILQLPTRRLAHISMTSTRTPLARSFRSVIRRLHFISRAAVREDPAV